MENSLKRPLDTKSPQLTKVLKTNENEQVDTSMCNNQAQAHSSIQKDLPLTLQEDNGNLLTEDNNSCNGSTGAVDGVSISSDDTSTNQGEQEDRDSESSLYICFICHQTFAGKTPLLLGCLHMFCSKCILKKKYLVCEEDSRIVKENLDKENDTTEPHPTIPDTALENLQQLKLYQDSSLKHLMLKCFNCNCLSSLNIITESHFVYQQNNTMGSLKSTELVDAKLCTSCDENYHAVRFCSTCEDYLCEECVTAHKRVKLTKDHALDTLDDSILSESGLENASQPIYCKNHAGEVLKLYCETCNVLTCRDCQLEKHRDHKYKFIKEAADQERLNLDAVQAKLKEKAESIKISKQNIKASLKNMEECQKSVLREVLTYHYELHQLVSNKSQSFLNEIKNVSEKQKMVLSNHMRLTQHMEDAVKHCSQFISVAQQKQNEFALLQAQNLISECVQELQGKTFDNLPAALDVVFFPNESAKETMEKCLGRLFWSPAEKCTENSSNETPPISNTIGPEEILVVETSSLADQPSEQETSQSSQTPNVDVQTAGSARKCHFTDRSIFERMQKLYSPSRLKVDSGDRDHQHNEVSSSTEKSLGKENAKQNDTSPEPDNPQDLLPPDLIDLNDLPGIAENEKSNADSNHFTGLVFNLAKQLDEHYSEDLDSPGDESDVVVLNPKVLEVSCDANEDWCAVCNNGGDLLCCESCPKVYHLQCHVPTLRSNPSGFWQCTLCRNLDESYSHSGNEIGLQGKEQRFCERMLLHLLIQPESINFQEPVKQSVPKYYKVIKKPMDLKKIRLKLDQSNAVHYGNVRAMIKDLQLMFTNCYVFNGENSVLGKQARCLQKCFFEKVLLYFQDLKPYLSQLVMKQKATLEAFLCEEENIPSDDDETSQQTVADAKLALEQDELWHPSDSDDDSSGTDGEKENRLEVGNVAVESMTHP